MIKTEQGVLIQSELLRLLACLLLSIIFIFSQNVFATSDKNSSSIENNIHLIFTAGNKLQSTIAQSIISHLNKSYNDVRVTHITSTDPYDVNQKKPAFIIAIGIDNIKFAENKFAKTDTIYITSNPGEFSLSKKIDGKKAVLYMSQPYCRQIQFINGINKQWKTIGYLSNMDKPIDSNAINQCANKYKMSTYQVKTTQNGNISNDIKDALENSDLILALPDKTIYNSKSVKNILLTSYRSRKPLIGFSKNFVNAGALASIHSNTEQIADSANKLIDDYYQQNKNFNQITHYPLSYEIDINRQVFKALNLLTPNLSKIKQTLDNANPDRSGGSR